MYAVIETGGKQYRVEVGTELEIDLLDVEPGQSVTLDRVLLVADGDDTAVGRPVVANAAVEAEVVRRDRGEKLIVFKYRPKARRRVKKGHRQDHTILRINDIRLNGKSAAEAARKAGQDAKTERQRLEEAAARQAAADAELAAKLARQAEPNKAPKGRSAKARTEVAEEVPDATAPKATPPEATAAEAAAPRRGRAKDAAQPAPEAEARLEAEPATEATAEPETAEPETAEPQAADDTDTSETSKGAPKRTRTKKDE